MSKTIIDDGFASYLVEGAKFVGKYQIPELSKHDTFIVPHDMIPFDKRNCVIDKDLAINFYMHDKMFKQILTATKKYIGELSQFKCVISPDCSLYRDMPLCIQIINTYINRAVAYFMQKRGIYVIPNIRWGDERSFEFCFDGIPKNDIVCISTYGCIQGCENKYYFKVGLRRMIQVLNPKIVLIYGSMPDSIFNEFSTLTRFVHYESYLSRIKGGNK